MPNPFDYLYTCRSRNSNKYKNCWIFVYNLLYVQMNFLYTFGESLFPIVCPLLERKLTMQELFRDAAWCHTFFKHNPINVLWN